MNLKRNLRFSCAVLLLAGVVSAQNPEGKTVSVGTLFRLPMNFIANAGQSQAAVRYESRSAMGDVALHSGGVTFSLPAWESTEAGFSASLSAKENRDHASSMPTVGVHRVTVGYKGANPSPRMHTRDPLPGKVSFFRGKDPTRWQQGLETFGTVVYDDLYPGIALELNGNTGRLKGTFVVAPGADPAVIAWTYSGVDSVTLDDSGDLVLGLPDRRLGVDGTLRELAPVAWQTIDGTKHDVASRFVVAADRSIRFVLGDYDRSVELTIDPTVIFRTYMGGNGTDHCIGVELNDFGDIYVGGRTHSNPAVTAGQGWPVTANAFDTTYNGEVADAYVLKISEDGSTLLFNSYIGGGDPVNFTVFGGADWGLDIDFDKQGNVYLVGFTEASNFPVTANAFQTTRSGPTDAFLSVFSPNGDGLIYSTLIGGVGTEVAFAVEIASDGRVWVGGSTSSIDFPTTWRSAQMFFGGVEDMFLMRFEIGVGVDYSTFLGFESQDNLFDMKLGPNNLVYVVGQSYSNLDIGTNPNFGDITVPQPTNNGLSDAIFLILDPKGWFSQDIVYATYWGGTGPDSALGLDIGPMGDAWICGQSGSMDFPLDNSSFPINGGGDMFAARIRPNGQGIVDVAFSTVLGASLFDLGFDIEEYNGVGYMVGAITGTFGTDAVVVEFGPFGQLGSIMGFGGPFFEIGIGIDVNDTGIAIVGEGQCQDSHLNFVNCASGFPFVNAIQPFFAGGSGDGWISKYHF